MYIKQQKLYKPQGNRSASIYDSLTTKLHYIEQALKDTITWQDFMWS